MEKLAELIGILEEMPNKICESSILYDILDDPTEEELNEGYKIIIEHNKKVLTNIKKENHILRDQIEKVQKKDKIEAICKVEEKEEQKIKERPNVLIKVETILNQEKQDALNKLISELSKEEIIYIKLAIYVKIKKLESKIHMAIMESSLNDITNLQIELLKLKNIISLLKPKEIEKEEQLEVETNKVLVLPNYKNDSYLLNDIQKYPDRIDEIKTVLDKVFSGYFLLTKDIKSITGAHEKLLEYKSPTGLRVMYITLPNDYILIVSLFYKDKNKSTKIEAYYDEAEKRYNTMKEKLAQSMLEDTFKLEQAELIGKIYDFLERNDKKNKEV